MRIPRRTTISLLACFLLLLGPAFVIGPARAVAQPLGGEWPSLTLDSQNSRYQSQSTITAANVGQLRQQWMFKTPRAVTSEPVVLDGSAYFADWTGNVYSVQIATGELNWKVNLGNPISSTPSLANGLVYVSLSSFDTAIDTAISGPDNGNRVVALSQSTGDILWQAILPSTSQGVWGSPTVFSGMLYIGAADGTGQSESDPAVGGTIFALNAATGAEVWTKSLSGTAGGAGLWGSVVADAALNAVFFGTGNSYATKGTIGDAYSIVSLNASTGNQNWKYQIYTSKKTGHDRDFGSTPNLFSLTIHGQSQDVIGLGNKNGNYYILNEQTGQLVRKLRVRTENRGGIIGLAAVAGAQTGSPQIFVPTYRVASDIADPAVCCGDVVALDPVQHRVTEWTSLAQGNVIGSVAAVPGAILYGDAKGDLYAVSSSSGRVLYQTQLGAAVEGGVTVAEGYVLVPARRRSWARPPTVCTRSRPNDFARSMSPSISICCWQYAFAGDRGQGLLSIVRFSLWPVMGRCASQPLGSHLPRLTAFHVMNAV